jgi:hypothetical protein
VEEWRVAIIPQKEAGFFPPFLFAFLSEMETEHFVLNITAPDKRPVKTARRQQSAPVVASLARQSRRFGVPPATRSIHIP